jgi:hypothetical protein
MRYNTHHRNRRLTTATHYILAQRYKSIVDSEDLWTLKASRYKTGYVAVTANYLTGIVKISSPVHRICGGATLIQQS